MSATDLKHKLFFLDWKCFLLLRLPGISLIESMLTLVGWWNVWRRVILDHMADFDLYPIASLIDVLIASIPLFCPAIYSREFERWKVKQICFNPLPERWKVKSFGFHSFLRSAKWKKCFHSFSRSEKWNQNASRSRSRSENSREFLTILKKRDF